MDKLGWAPYRMESEMDVEILDIGAACRLCLAVCSDHVPIFDESEANFTDPLSLPQRIGACVGFELSRNDELPSSVCSNCLVEVDRWFVFRNQCQNTNELLSKVLVEGCQFVTASVQEKTFEPNTSVEIIVQNNVSELENNHEVLSETVEKRNHRTTATSVSKLVEPNNCVDSKTNIISENQTVLSNANDSDNIDCDEFEANEDDVASDFASDNIDDGEDFSVDDLDAADTNNDTYWRLKPVACPICSKKFSKHSGVKLHLRIVHTVLKLYPCYICGHVSCLSTGRIKHIAKRHPQETMKRNSCKICGIRVKTGSSLYRHAKKHVAERQCNLCNVVLDSIEALGQHQKSDHQENPREEPPDGMDQNFSCHHCENVSFWNEKDWRAHYLDVHNTEDVFPCNMCERAYRKERLLRIHLRSHTGEKPYMCEQCPTRFSSAETLRNHMRKHTSKFECDICNKTYTSYQSLYSHKRSHTGERPYVCHECGKLFKSLQGVQYHARIHSGEKPYSCEICGYLCRTSSGLYSHRVTHTEERPYKCDECGKTFKMKAWMKTHKLTHTGVKNFVCEVCDHAFIANYQLKSHMKTHSGERTHVCEFCSKTFARRDTLTEHLRTHTKETKYTCQSCNREFMFLKQFKKHRCAQSSLGSVPELSVSDSFDGSN